MKFDGVRLSYFFPFEEETLFLFLFERGMKATFPPRFQDIQAVNGPLAIRKSRRHCL
jgi:hypothetical protein